MIFSQIFQMVNIGIVVLDKDLKVSHWNRWMALHSGIAEDDIVGASIFDFYPDLKTPRFARSCKSVLAFGNFSFFSQKLHRYLFPFMPDSPFAERFDYMQQSCTMGPLRDEENIIRYLYITVQDVTEVVSYEQKLLEMNMQDNLTGIYNRRFLEAYLKREFEQHKRYMRPLSIMMLDIDFFKKVNDTYGHQCGDFVLKSVSSEIVAEVRRVDCVARYGGEEFCCLLPETQIRDAMMVAERVRRRIASRSYDFHETSINLTVSIGVSELSQDMDSEDILVRTADEALYDAKKTGRNKVVALQLAGPGRNRSETR
jgi:diguanylate cyclase